MTQSKVRLLLDTLERRLEVFASAPIWIVGFSGGKDSTLLLHVVVEFIKTFGVSRKTPKISILYNDTLGEIPSMHRWAIYVGTQAAKYLREKLSIDADFVIAKPPIVDTYYWRVLVRGYPAPNFKFRWCIKLLKIEPTKSKLKDIVNRYGNAVLLTGLRDDESSARAKAIKSRVLGCEFQGGGPSCLGNYILKTDFEKTTKYAPLRDLREDDVWYILKNVEPPWDDRSVGYKPLLLHYLMFGALNNDLSCKVRFGCWFCTVATRHCGLEAAIKVADLVHRMWSTIFPNLSSLKILYDVRRLIRMLSDRKELREVKNYGYSKLGPLKLEARTLLLNVFRRVFEKLGMEVLYGLSEKYEVPGYGKLSLYDIFVRLDPKEASDVIKKVDRSSRARSLDIEQLRDFESAEAKVFSNSKLKDVEELYRKIVEHI